MNQHKGHHWVRPSPQSSCETVQCSFEIRLGVTFVVKRRITHNRGGCTLVNFRAVTGFLGGDSPGTRTRNQWIKSPLLCH